MLLRVLLVVVGVLRFVNTGRLTPSTEMMYDRMDFVSSEASGSIGTSVKRPVELMRASVVSPIPPNVMLPPFELFELSLESARVMYGRENLEARLMLTES